MFHLVGHGDARRPSPDDNSVDRGHVEGCVARAVTPSPQSRSRRCWSVPRCFVLQTGFYDLVECS
jgi:hypothetical protein